MKEYASEFLAEYSAQLISASGKCQQQKIKLIICRILLNTQN